MMIRPVRCMVRATNTETQCRWCIIRRKLMPSAAFCISNTWQRYRRIPMPRRTTNISLRSPAWWFMDQVGLECQLLQDSYSSSIDSFWAKIVTDFQHHPLPHNHKATIKTKSTIRAVKTKSSSDPRTSNPAKSKFTISQLLVGKKRKFKIMRSSQTNRKPLRKSTPKTATNLKSMRKT